MQFWPELWTISFVAYTGILCAISRPRLARGQLFQGAYGGARRKPVDAGKKRRWDGWYGGGREEKKDPPVVEVAPATSWRGRTRPTIPKKLEAEERRTTLESRLKRRLSSKSRSIDLEIPLESRRRPAKTMSARSTLNFIQQAATGTLLLSLFLFFFFFFFPRDAIHERWGDSWKNTMAEVESSFDNMDVS